MLVMHPIWGNEKTLRENYIMSVLSYLGTKKLKRMNIWRSKTVLHKTCIFSVFEIVTHKKHQNACKVRYMGKKIILQETSLRYQNAKTSD